MGKYVKGEETAEITKFRYGLAIAYTKPGRDYLVFRAVKSRRAAKELLRLGGWVRQPGR